MSRRNKRSPRSPVGPGAVGGRDAVAAEAARLLALGDETEMGAAKRRASATLGAGRGEQPSNLEVQRALAEYQRLFEPEETRERHQRLRGVALHAMRYLEEFRPKLVGPVLYGTACDYTPVTLHVFCDEPEAVLRQLMALGVRVDTDARDLRYGDGSVRSRVVYLFDREEIDFDVVVMPEIEVREPPLSAVDGRPAKRASYSEVLALVEAEEAGAV